MKPQKAKQVIAQSKATFYKTMKQTSENVREEVRCFFLLAKIIAETASLEFVANGIAMKEMKKEGILVASEKLSTASTSGSANMAAITVPRSTSKMALKQVQVGLSTFSTTSSPLSSNKLCSSRVFCKFKGFERCYYFKLS